MSAFEDFVNVEVPKRIGFASVPVGGNATAGKYPRFTGTGLTIDEGEPLLLNSGIGSNTYSGLTEMVTIGESVVYGDVLFLKSADSKYWKGLGTNAATTYPIAVMALGAGSADASIRVLRIGYVDKSTWSWSGGLVYLSPSTAGAMTQTQPATTGNIVQVLGTAYSATKIFFNPNQVWIEIA